MTHYRHRALAVGLLVLYFAAAVHMAFALPALATPNELLNFEYVQVMRQIRGLPNRGLVDSEVRYTEWHQPPLYFAFAALFGLSVPVPAADTNPPPPIAMPANPHYLATPAGNRNPVVHIGPANTPLLYTSRVAAALLGALGVAALYAAGKRVYGPAAGLLMASVLAFQPTYIHLSGSVNNDMPLTAVVAVVMSYAVLLMESSSRKGREGSEGRQEEISRKDAENAKLRTLSFAFFASLREIFPFFVLGLLCAAAILTKANGVFVLAFPAVVWLGLVIGRWSPSAPRAASEDADSARGPGPSPLAAAAATAAGLLPLWVGWLWLNAVRMRDALGLSGSLPVGRVLRLSPLDFSHVLPFLPAVWRSYWLDWSAGDVGYGPDWLYAFWLAAVVGMLLGWMKRRGAGEQGSRGEPLSPRLPGSPAPLPNTRLITPMVVLAFLGISYLYFAVKALTVKEAGWMVPEGRWWLPGLPMLAWLLAAGYARWWSPRRRER
ncbi:MAG: glycosyltransferase family 39 protein, partial [Candidatus Promineofilum sp.]|nr:glycosyltransferase family 39 protein [Promineifilum sp.]